MPQCWHVPDVITYTAASIACEKAGKRQGASALFAAMSYSRLMSDAITYRNAISFARRWESGRAFLRCLPQYRRAASG